MTARLGGRLTSLVRLSYLAPASCVHSRRSSANRADAGKGFALRTIAAPADQALTSRGRRHQHQLAILCARDDHELSDPDGRAYHAQFVSALAIALIRGFARRSAQTIGNFWVDMTRTVLYVLLPISIVVGLFFVWQGALPRRRRDFMPFDGRGL
jgi:hypothetical protein